MNPRQKRIQKEKDIKERNRRFYKRNTEAMSWCNKQGLTIYASSQSKNSSSVKIFVQKGMPFKPLNNILYDQNDPEDVKNYIAAIDEEYERLYLKMKNRV